MNEPTLSTPLESWIESISGRKLFARSWTCEEPAGVVLLVHGLGDHSGRFEPVAQTFCRSGFNVVSFDAMGHGRTGGSMPEFAVLAADLAKVIGWVRDSVTVPIILYGQSLGGGLVLHHGLSDREPVDCIIAGSPLLRPAFQPPAWKLLIGRTLGRFWPSLTVGTGLNPNHLTSDPNEVARYLNDPVILRHVSAALGISMLEEGENSLLRARQLVTPTLIMHGTSDLITSYQASQEFANRAGKICELKLWPNLLHDLHFEIDKDSVLAFAIEWIRDKLNEGAVSNHNKLPGKPR
jgi:alpha-beta hydrolase superfamily lysophospholipase